MGTEVEDLYPDIDGDRVFLAYLKSIWYSVYYNQYNFLGVITGKHRVGKSISALMFSTILDKTFYPNLEKRVVYYPEQFMEALRDLAKKKIIGGAIVWDEAGVGITARSWYDMSNKSINFVTQVMGYLRPIIYFVTQDMTYIDSQPRKLFHAFYECSRTSNRYNIVKPFEIHYDKKKGMIYYKYPRINKIVEDVIGSKIKLTRIRVAKPPNELIKRYETHSFSFKDKIMEQMEERVKRFDTEEGISKKAMTQSEIVDRVVNNYRKYEGKKSKYGDPILDKTLIRFDFQIPEPLSKFIKVTAEKKIKTNQLKEMDQMDPDPNIPDLD